MPRPVGCCASLAAFCATFAACFVARIASPADLVLGSATVDAVADDVVEVLADRMRRRDG